MIVASFNIDTVGDLKAAMDLMSCPRQESLVDGNIYVNGRKNVVKGVLLVETTLSDGSKVLDIEFLIA